MKVLSGVACFALSVTGLLSLTFSASAQESKRINPFAPATPVRDDSRPGTVTLSDGTVLKGHVYTTRDKRLRIFDAKDKTRKDIPLEALSTIEVNIEKEGLEKDWRWKEEGSDVKLYTGHAYPWKQYVTTIALLDGEKITGHVNGLVYIQTDKETQKFILHEKDKGEKDQKLTDIVYLKKVELTKEKEKE